MIPEGDMILRLLVTAVLSGLIGFERHTAHRPAGIRTNILVGLGGAIAMLLSQDLAVASASIDPGRFAGQVLTGIGFIGAGVIFHARGDVQGITTAATIFVVACIGLAAGAGAYALALTATLLSLITLRIIGQIEHKR